MPSTLWRPARTLPRHRAPRPAERFLQRILEARSTEHDGIGLGRDLRFAAVGVAGAGMVAGDELLQLTAFPDAGAEAAEEETPRTHIRRPSRRRAA